MHIELIVNCKPQTSQNSENPCWCNWHLKKECILYWWLPVNICDATSHPLSWNSSFSCFSGCLHTDPWSECCISVSPVLISVYSLLILYRLFQTQLLDFDDANCHLYAAYFTFHTSSLVLPRSSSVQLNYSPECYTGTTEMEFTFTVSSPNFFSSFLSVS